jgi:hypothetical protein
MIVAGVRALARRPSSISPLPPVVPASGGFVDDSDQDEGAKARVGDVVERSVWDGRRLSPLLDLAALKHGDTC